ncbi:MAG: energy-coupling factor transporter transmembrane protein EcfT [Clostridia bacterium]|nr:energy-coupling factor transporter transmembrane protein EcfT [Clostridia bacterium]
MSGEISLGRYVEGDSPLHKLDPRIKIVMFFLYMVVVFTVSVPQVMAMLALCLMLQIIVARLPLKVIGTSITPVLPVAVFIFILNAVTNKKGDVVFSRWIITITDIGLKNATITAIRLILMIVSTSIFLTLTTTPLKISEALESLLAPLKLIKFPVHELSMMMSIALRFIPTLIEETDKIMKAQVSRGADYDTGSIVNRIKGYTTILIPLLISSFKRADELAIAMDARCYHGGEGRTKLNPLKLTMKDILIGLFMLLCAVALLVLNNIWK